jgi:peptide methionine sulfoxide reductase MsrB
MLTVDAPCRSETKFNSGCGWPAFYDHIPGSVERHEDNNYGMKRVSAGKMKLARERL